MQVQIISQEVNGFTTHQDHLDNKAAACPKYWQDDQKFALKNVTLLAIGDVVKVGGKISPICDTTQSNNGRVFLKDENGQTVLSYPKISGKNPFIKQDEVLTLRAKFHRQD